MCAGRMHLMNVCDYTLCPFYQRSEIGVFNPNSWNSPRMRASEGLWRWKTFCYWVSLEPLQGCGLRHDGCREAVPQSRYNHLFIKIEIMNFFTWEMECNLLAKYPRRSSNQSRNLPPRVCSDFGI